MLQAEEVTSDKQEERNFSLLLSIQTGSEIHQALFHE